MKVTRITSPAFPNHKDGGDDDDVRLLLLLFVVVVVVVVVMEPAADRMHMNNDPRKSQQALPLVATAT